MYTCPKAFHFETIGYKADIHDLPLCFFPMWHQHPQAVELQDIINHLYFASCTSANMGITYRENMAVVKCMLDGKTVVKKGTLHV